jgi:acyl-CoA thioester hydrolase
MTEPEFRHQLRVRYVETDAGGVAHHSSYVPWLEEARTEWMRAQGRSYAALEASGFFLMVAEMRLRYLSPVRYDDELEISVSVKVRKRASIDLEYVIRRVGRDDPVATATTLLACTDRAGKVRRLPEGV